MPHPPTLLSVSLDDESLSEVPLDDDLLFLEPWLRLSGLDEPVLLDLRFESPIGERDLSLFIR